MRSEGVAATILAIQNGHTDMQSEAEAGQPQALAIVAGTAVNQDGRSSSLTAPNGPSQQAAMRAAHSASHLGPMDVSFLEMHGTGTSLGGQCQFEPCMTWQIKREQDLVQLWHIQLSRLIEFVVGTMPVGCINQNESRLERQVHMIFRAFTLKG